MINKILLKRSPKDKPQAITPTVYLTGKHGYVVLGPVQIGSQAGRLAATLRRLADELEPVIEHTAFDRVLTITPAEVVAHFENSPILRSMASDVRAVLLNGTQAANFEAQSQLEQDLEQVFRAGLDHTASKADIAQAITGKRAWGGDSMKKRLDDIQNLLTSVQKSPQQTKETSKAA